MSFSPYKSQVIEMVGGINENVSSLSLSSGELTDCKNYMIAPGTSGGYVSIKGYERYDGTGTPSQSGTTIIELEGLAEEVSGSPDQFDIYGEPFLVSGVYGDDAIVSIEALDPNEVVAKGDTLTWGLVSGTVNKVLPLSSATDAHHGAIEALREGITEVPGEGPVLGVHVFEDNVYAFRKEVSLETVGMWKEDPTSGWVKITTPTIAYGDNKFEFRNYNFSANVDEYSMYWIDGVNNAFEYNGTSVVAIDSGMVPDAPTHIVIHGSFYLGLAFRGGSFQLFTKTASVWNGLYEFGMGHTIVELGDGKEDSTILFLSKGIKMLTGTAESEFTINSLTENANTVKGSVREMLGTFFYVDDNGLTTLSSTDQYGNYLASSISDKFQKTLLNKPHEVSASCISREYKQYRVFFDDGVAIAVTFKEGELAGATTLEYNTPVVQTTQGSVQGSNKESTFFLNGISGYVYKMDSGTSFDGVNIICRLSTAFYHYGSPRTYKTAKRATMEVSGEPGQLFSAKTEFDYNEGDYGPSIWYTHSLYNKSGTAVWGESRWGTMVWGTAESATNRLYLYLAGYFTNMSYKFISNETYREPHVLQDIITDYILNGRRI